MSRGLFITGTDTGVGKTQVAAAIAASLRAADKKVGVYKPVASGCPVNPCGDTISEDAVILWHAAGRPGPLEAVCPQRFPAPLAPHLAAHASGTKVDRELLRSGIQPWLDSSDIVIVEGAGGLLSPISDEDFVADLARDLGFPLVIVVDNRIGAINQALQTVCVALRYDDLHDVVSPDKNDMAVKNIGLPIAGLVLNNTRHRDDAYDMSRDSNRTELERLASVPVLAELEFEADRFDRDIDWWNLAKGKSTQ
jgi:dethiobiotin synthetase